VTRRVNSRPSCVLTVARAAKRSSSPVGGRRRRLRGDHSRALRPLRKLSRFPQRDIPHRSSRDPHWLWYMSLPKELSFFMGVVDPGDILRACRLAAEGRLRFIEGDTSDALPGIDLFIANDTHTEGSMWVRVRGGSESDSFVIKGRRWLDPIRPFRRLSGGRFPTLHGARPPRTRLAAASGGGPEESAPSRQAAAATGHRPERPSRGPARAARRHE
jgi:hypothetical protein